MRAVLVGGTWSWKGRFTSGEWWQDGSPFHQFLRARGVEVLSADRPFVWTSRLNGCWGDKKLDWDTAGANLACYLDPAMPETGLSGTERFDVLITHSHGLQVALFAAAFYGARIPLLISVAGPIREDMHEVAAQARLHIREWKHVYSDWSDKIQVAGSFFDGTFGIRRRAVWPGDRRFPMVAADWSYGVPGVGHSGLVREARHFHWWDDLALLRSDRS